MRIGLWGKLTVCSLLILLPAVFLISCSSHSKEYDEAPGYDDSREGVNSDSSLGTGDANVRHIILTGSMDLTAKDTRETVKRVKEISTAAGGVISSSSINEDRDGRQRAFLTLRIPTTKYGSVFDQLESLGKAANIKHHDEDVTMPYLNLEARLKNLIAHEDQVRQILAMAKTVDEVLTVERELGRVRGEIEAMTAQFNHLKDQVSYSTIKLNIYEETLPSQKISSRPFENLGERMKGSFVRSINFVLSMFTGLLIVISALLPVIIFLLAVILVIRFVIIKAKRKPPAA